MHCGLVILSNSIKNDLKTHFKSKQIEKYSLLKITEITGNEAIGNGNEKSIGITGNR